MATRYWVGNGGTWDASSTTHWSASSGGASGASAPTASDDVIFDANSITSAGQTVALSSAVCRAINCTGMLNTPTFSLGSWTIWGSATFISAMVISGSSATINFELASDVTNTITTNGVTLAVTSINFFKTSPATNAATFSLGSDFTGATAGFTKQIRIIDVTFNTNNYNLTCGNLSIENTPIITLGTSTINTGFIQIDTTTGTFSAASATITCTRFQNRLDDMSIGTLNYNVGSFGVFFNNTDSITFGTVNILGTLSYKDASLFFEDNNEIVVTGTLTIAGVDASHRLFLHAAQDNFYISFPTRKVISAGTVVLSNTDFHNIEASGASTPWTGTSIGNAGHNLNIIFPASVTRYWVGGEGEWRETAHWSTTSGGAGGATAPLAHDDAVFDDNSISPASDEWFFETGTFLGGRKVLARNITFSGTGVSRPNEIYLDDDCIITGSLTMLSGTQIFYQGYPLVFTAEGDSTLTMDGNTLDDSASGDTYFSCIGGTLTLQDDFTALGTLFLGAGELITNDKTVTIPSILTATSFNSGNWDTSALTLTFGASTINVNTFESDDATITESTSEIICSGTTPRFLGGYSENRTFYNVTMTGAVNSLYGTNSFNTLTIPSGKTIKFSLVEEHTFLDDFIADGATIRSVTNGFQHFLIKASGIVQVTGADIMDSNASGGATFYAFNSTDSGNNDGWIFFLPVYKPSLISAVTRVQQGISAPSFIIGGQQHGDSETYALFKKSNSYNFNMWRSWLFEVSKPFNITSIEIPLTGPIASGFSIIPVLGFDDGQRRVIGTTISSGNYDAGERYIKLQPDDFDFDVHGENNFYVELCFFGNGLMGIALPINIELETESTI